MFRIYTCIYVNIYFIYIITRLLPKTIIIFPIRLSKILPLRGSRDGSPVLVHDQGGSST